MVRKGRTLKEAMEILKEEERKTTKAFGFLFWVTIITVLVVMLFV